METSKIIEKLNETISNSKITSIENVKDNEKITDNTQQSQLESTDTKEKNVQNDSKQTEDDENKKDLPKENVDHKKNDELPKIISKNKNYTTILQKLKEDFYQRWFENKPSQFGSLSGYDMITVIGTGSYGTVRLMRQKNGNKCYAVKVLLKAKIIKDKQLANIFSEKRVLNSIRFPFLVHLEFSLKDNDCVYLALPYIGGGELFFYHRKCRKFTETVAKFYASQVFLAIDYLHNVNLIYRDLKPENILIDEKGYLKLTDFGFCKKIDGRTWTLCGTPEYLAPELLQAKGYGMSVDWWAFGIFVYELVAGVSPFFTPSGDTMAMYTRIVKNDYKIPSTFSKDLRDLVENLVQTNISKRYGNLKNGSNDIKNHVWFKHTNWYKILLRQVEPPYIPKIKGPADWSNFDKYPDLNYKKAKFDKYAKEFQDF